MLKISWNWFHGNNLWVDWKIDEKFIKFMSSIGENSLIHGLVTRFLLIC